MEIQRKMKPILFSTPMVRAILDGRKTQTRRVVKKQPHGAGEWIMIRLSWLFPNVNPYLNIKCPYGSVGDVLWVRETWVRNNGELPTDIGYVYRAELGLVELEYSKELKVKWKPSIFMPKEACRIRLKITDIRVERLQDISEEDAIKEGAPESMSIDELKVLQGMDWIIPRPFLMHQFGFLALWCKINGQKSWLNNPWVWVLSFVRIQL